MKSHNSFPIPLFHTQGVVGCPRLVFTVLVNVEWVGQHASLSRGRCNGGRGLACGVKSHAKSNKNTNIKREKITLKIMNTLKNIFLSNCIV